MKQQLGVAALLGVLAWPAATFAYCRTTTCAQSNPPAECNEVPPVDGCQMSGLPLYWAKSCVSFSVQQDGSAKCGITATELEEVVRRSFDNWQNAACSSGGKPNITVETYPQVECRESRYNQTAGNQNVWLFRDADWPYEGGGAETIALTLVSFSPKTGEIYDVDVEMNSAARQFSLTVPTPFGYDDLMSVVQHESGHFLGLAHSALDNATMWTNYGGSIDMRTLDSDDIEGVCAIFGAVATKDDTCDPEPRHGFSTKCAGDDDGGCGSCAIGNNPNRSRRAGLFALALGALLLGRGSRRRA